MFVVFVYLFEVGIVCVGLGCAEDCWWDLARGRFGFLVIWVLVWFMAVWCCDLLI